MSAIFWTAENDECGHMFGLVVKCLFAGSFLGEVLAEICIIRCVLSGQCHLLDRIQLLGRGQPQAEK